MMKLTTHIAEQLGSNRLSLKANVFLYSANKPLLGELNTLVRKFQGFHSNKETIIKTT